MVSKLELIDSLSEQWENESVLNEIEADIWKEDFAMYEIDVQSEANNAEWF